MNLRDVREEKHMSQIQLEKLTGIKQSTISQYENGTRKPSLSRAKIIAEALEVPINDIFLLFDIS